MATQIGDEITRARMIRRLKANAGMFGKRDLEKLMYLWPLWARDSQLEPAGDWAVWLLLAGRGFGKTRTGSEWIRAGVDAGKFGRVALVARTPADVRDVMIEGDSGLREIYPERERPKWESTRRRLSWSNGATALAFTSYEPDQLRGPQFDAAWCDELASWQYPRETWDNLMFGLRLGERPRCVVTTTPKPIALLRELIGRSDVHITRGNTYENKANLAPSFIHQIEMRYEGTGTGRQEIYAELLEEAEGALWRREWIKQGSSAFSGLHRVVVAIDPAMTSRPDSDETGIIVAGASYAGANAKGYVLWDGSGRMSPDAWARRALELYDRFSADRIIAETNNGGDLVLETLRTAARGREVAVRQVTASRGKWARAEPVAALYEQGRVYHDGAFQELEDQLCTWEPDSSDSPDRMDALVWALSDLITSRMDARIWTGANDDDGLA